MGIPGVSPVTWKQICLLLGVLVQSRCTWAHSHPYESCLCMLSGDASSHLETEWQLLYGSSDAAGNLTNERKSWGDLVWRHRGTSYPPYVLEGKMQGLWLSNARPLTFLFPQRIYDVWSIFLFQIFSFEMHYSIRVWCPGGRWSWIYFFFFLPLLYLLCLLLLAVISFSFEVWYLVCVSCIQKTPVINVNHDKKKIKPEWSASPKVKKYNST